MFKIKKPSTVVDIMGEPTCVGNWKREKELGSGGFGIVNLWINRKTRDALAIKKCKWNLETHLTPRQRERWIQEVEMIQNNIRHENIVSYRKLPDELQNALASANVTGLPILSMEYCPLGNLRSVLEQTQNCCGLREIDVLCILKDISAALIYLHTLNITHRDLKPENVVLQHSNVRKNRVVYKLIDLGYAKEIDNATVSFVGTLQYLAPEIFAKDKYNPSVDYWSLGITAFEISCGIRPFLPALNVWHCITELENKPSDVIAIQKTHTGDIELIRELLRENHLNMCLRQSLERWLRSALEYDPQKRGLFENNNQNIFQAMQSIASMTIITVFSVYTYEFYSYEINESTLFSTLRDWIARDTKIQKADQFLVTSKVADGSYAMDYYDEINTESMIFVFKKDAWISRNVYTVLPKFIKILFTNPKTEFKFGTLRLLFAQTIYLIEQEANHVNALKNAICFQSDCLKNTFNKESKLFVSVRSLLNNFVPEIEFYNHVETSLFAKVYKDTNNVEVKTCLLEYQRYMRQLQEMIGTINTISQRRQVIISKNNRLKRACDRVLDKVVKCDFTSLSVQAINCYEKEKVVKRVSNFVGSPELLKVISKTLKIRDTLLKDSDLRDFLKCAASFWKELNKLISCMTAIQSHFNTTKDGLRQIVVKKLGMLQNLHRNEGFHSPSAARVTGAELVTENTSLRYDLQNLMNLSFLKHKNILTEINEESALGFALENGIH